MREYKRVQVHFTQKSLTEQHHKKDCDPYNIIKKAQMGLPIGGRGGNLNYGYDDTTMDGLQYRIMKQHHEQEINQLLENEFTAEEYDIIKDRLPKNLVNKIKVKKKLEEKIEPTDTKKSEVKDERNAIKTST